MMIATIVLHSGFSGAETLGTGFATYAQCLSARIPVSQAMAYEIEDGTRAQHHYIIFNCFKEFEIDPKLDWRDLAELHL